MGRDRDEGRPVDPGEARTAGYDEGRQRADGLGPDIPASGPTGTEERRMGTVGPRVDGGVTEGYAEGGTGQHITREDIRRAARDGVVDREEELKTDGAYGSSTSDPILPAALAELIGTFILVFGGTAVAVGAILSLPTAGGAYGSLAIALAFGLALAAVVASIGHVSGAHVNPAVTLGLASIGQFPWKSVPYYLGAQLVGAVLGAVGTWIAFGGPGRNDAKLAATYPAQGVGDLQAFLLEILITFVLVFVVVAVATDSRAPAAIAPIAVGFALVVGVFIAGPVTGGAVNPVRALGPMLVAGDLTSVWLYILGPIVGGVLGAFVYEKTMAQH
jgi:MIP family channel proteins